jgi:hypothetical protein
MALKEAGAQKEWACKKRSEGAGSQPAVRAARLAGLAHGLPRGGGHYYDHRASEGSDEMPSREEVISCTLVYAVCWLLRVNDE